jgi:hypothetical protein
LGQPIGLLHLFADFLGYGHEGKLHSFSANHLR